MVHLPTAAVRYFVTVFVCRIAAFGLHVQSGLATMVFSDKHEPRGRLDVQVRNTIIVNITFIISGLWDLQTGKIL